MAAEIPAPTRGASMYTHRRSRRPDATAGPNWRAGLTEPPVARTEQDDGRADQEVLQRAGLITSTRHANMAIHQITRLGTGLLATSLDNPR
jgi:hypothetical protein